MKTIYIVEEDSSGDGTAYRDIAAFFSKEEQEEVYLQNKNWRMKHTMIVFESVAEFHEYQFNDIRKRALAKLTAEERRVLGVD